MSEKFKPGDTVRLKSGGPKMTIIEFGRFQAGAVGGYLCRWFDEKHKLVEGVFTEPELALVIESASPRTRYGVASKGF